MVVLPTRFHFLTLIGCGVCVASLPLRAQQTPAGFPPVQPANPGAAAIPGYPPVAPERPDVHLNFVKADVVDILRYYEQLSGKHVLYDNSVTGSITIDVNGVTRTDALRIIETALNLNDFSLVPGDNNIVKAVGLGKNPRNRGLPIFAELGTLPDTEQVVSYILRLRYLDPTETAGVLNLYIPPTSGVFFTPLKSANALLLTDTARNVRRLVALISQLDLPASPVTEKFITLKRADVAKAVEFLNGVFETKASGGSSAPGVPAQAGSTTSIGRRPIRRVGEDGQPVDVGFPLGLASGLGGLPVLSGESLIQGRITLTADIRTNRVHVVTSPYNMPLVERLLEEFDADTPFAEPVRRSLRFVLASEMLPILVDALKEPGTEGNGGSPSTANPTSPNRSGNSNSGFFNNNGSSGSSGSSGSFGGSTSGSGNGNSSFGSEANTQEVDTKPTEATVGNTRIIADQRTNTIILLGGADAKSKVFKILDELDKRTPQVVIRTIIGEMSLDNNHELGFQYLLRSNRGSLVSNYNPGFFNSAAVPAATPGSSPTSVTSALNTFGTIATGLSSSFTGVGGVLSIGKSLDLIVSALDANNRFKTISNPTIVTQNNRKAFISSGTKIAIAEQSISSLATTGTSTGISSTTQYIDVLLKLEVTPFINSEKEVTLDIAQEINSLSGTSNNINGSSAPNINTRQLQNHVSVANGSTIVLGGLITQSDNRTSSDIPYLSRIPVLGNLFKTRTKDNNRAELIILMHPEVINTVGAVDANREHEENRTYLGHDLEDQLLPTFPVRKALPVTKSETTVKSTYVPDDKLHPVRKTTVSVKKRTTTTTVRQND